MYIYTYMCIHVHVCIVSADEVQESKREPQHSLCRNKAGGPFKRAGAYNEAIKLWGHQVRASRRWIKSAGRHRTSRHCTRRWPAASPSPLPPPVTQSTSRHMSLQVQVGSFKSIGIPMTLKVDSHTQRDRYGYRLKEWIVIRIYHQSMVIQMYHQSQSMRS